ncbi:hypothetical protein [uncultured Thiodictyon sp.]|uniref:hypothetical protein n=1 Tax=uncultured Thiodictyon sp. TaxID=1846217 RepID=UPI0025D7C79C|nr:hypothetical protein [uncultured Thiodictyon sp.]
MTTRVPLVLVDGIVRRLAAGDDVSGATPSPVFTLSNANAGAITIGQAVYSSATGAVDLAKADSIGTSQVLGLVGQATIGIGGSGTVQYGGVLSSANWTAVMGATTLTAGAVYYLDASTAGKLTANPPDATGKYVVKVGTALSTTELHIEIDSPVGA